MGFTSHQIVPTACRIALLLAACLAGAIPAKAQSVVLQAVAGGFTVSGSNPSFSAGFGNVNGLGIGTAGTGVSVTTSGVTGGALYMTSYNLVVSGAAAKSAAVIRAYVSTNFSHSAILQLKSCYPSASCSSAASYTLLSTSSAAPTNIIPIPGVLNGTYTASLAVFVSNANGAGAFSGSDSATISIETFTYDPSKGTISLKSTDTLTLNSPSENVQTALHFVLAAAGGLTVSPASDFSMNFGSVNGLGIGPAAGLTSRLVTGGALYSTPYQLQTAFSSFTTSAGTLKVYASTNFAHPAILELRDSPTGTTFTAIPTSAGSATTLTAAATSGGSLTRYLGLFVSNVNGASAFTGADNAILTYTLTVP